MLKDLKPLFTRVRGTLATMSAFYHAPTTAAQRAPFAGYATQIDDRITKFDAFVAAVERRASCDGGHIPPKVEADIRAKCEDFMSVIDKLVATAASHREDA